MSKPQRSSNTVDEYYAHIVKKDSCGYALLFCVYLIMTSNRPATDLPPNVFTLTHTTQLEALYTIIRDKNTPRQGPNLVRPGILD